MLKRSICGSVLAVVCGMSMLSVPVSAIGFAENEWGTRYVDEDGNYITDNLVEINGKKYAFTNTGYVIKGLYIYNDNDRYGYPRMRYFDDTTGEMLTGMHQVFARQYYFDKETGFAVYDDFVKVGDS